MSTTKTETPCMPVLCARGLPMTFSATFPVMWDWEGNDSDGQFGPAVTDPGTIYIEADDGQFNLVCRSSLKSMVDDALDGVKDGQGAIANMHVPATQKLLTAFEEAAQLLRDALPK